MADVVRVIQPSGGFPYTAYKLPYLGTPDDDPHGLVLSVADLGDGVTEIVLDATTGTLDFSAPPDNAAWQQPIYDLLGNLYASATWANDDVMVVQRVDALLDAGARIGAIMTWDGVLPRLTTDGYGAYALRSGAGHAPSSAYYRGSWLLDASSGTPDALARVMEFMATHYAYTIENGYNRPYSILRRDVDSAVLDTSSGGDGAGTGVTATKELDTCNVVATCDAALAGDVTIHVETWVLVKNRLDFTARAGIV